MISLALVMTFVITIGVLALIYWLVSLVPIPEPFKQIIKVVFIVVAVVLAIRFLLGLVGVVLF